MNRDDRQTHTSQETVGHTLYTPYFYFDVFELSKSKKFSTPEIR